MTDGFAEAPRWLKPPFKSFSGNEPLQVDARFRVRLPLDFVDSGEREVVVTLSQSGDCLEVWPKWRYEAFYRKLWEKTSMSTDAGFYNYGNREYMDLVRDLVMYHSKVTIDESLRLTIPQQLRERLNINAGDTLVAVGHVETVELWPEKAFSEYEQAKSSRDPSRVFRAEGRGAGEFGGDAGPVAPSV